MHTLVHLFKHVKEQGRDPFLLEVIRAVIGERLSMPHAAVWWIMEDIRLGHETIGGKKIGLDVRVKTAKSIGVKEHILYHDVQPQRGYLLGYYVLTRPRGAWDADWDYEEFVIDEAHAEEMTRRYIEK